MEPRPWITFWKWIAIYFRMLLSNAPNKKEAARAAGISEEKLNNGMRRTGVPFVLPLRRFFGMRPMPEFLVRFLDEAEKYYQASLTPPPPPSFPHRPRVEPATSV
jgi:hypothetical protein